VIFHNSQFKKCLSQIGTVKIDVKLTSQFSTRRWPVFGRPELSSSLPFVWMWHPSLYRPRALFSAPREISSGILAQGNSDILSWYRSETSTGTKEQKKARLAQKRFRFGKGNRERG
jgi:hypothetical protein